MNIILKCFWIKNVIEATIQPTPKTKGIININPLLESGIVVVVVVSAKTLTGISGNKEIVIINHRLILILHMPEGRGFCLALCCSIVVSQRGGYQ